MITVRSFATAAATLFCILVVATTAPIVRGQSLDSFNPNVGLTVLATALQPDGKIVIGGDFTTIAPNGGPTVTRSHIARLNPDGTLDPDFNPNANGQVRALVVQTDGKVIAGGSFTTIGGQMRNYVARLDATTGQADSFDPKPSIATGVDSLALQADGKILLGGSFTSLAPNGGTAVLRQRIARLNGDGTLDTTFGMDIGANNSVLAIVPQSNGNILVSGLFTNINAQARDHVAQLTANGSPTSFNPGVLNGPVGFAVQSLAVQADGKVVIVGSFTSVATQTRDRVARLDGTTGAVDSFNPNANNNMFAVAIQPDGKILVGGGMNGANSIGGATRNRIARLDPATGLADAFDPNAENVVFSIFQQPDGKIVLGGAFQTLVGQTRHRMARLGSYQLLNAVSRKVHGTAGTFDINLPLNGPPGVECRSSGGNHSLILTFSDTVVSGNATVTGGMGSVVGSPAFNANTMTFDLTGVADAQSVTISLSGVTDSSAEVLPDTALKVNFLVADSNGDTFVNSADATIAGNNSGQTTAATNLRTDYNLDGFINSADATIVRARSGNSIPMTAPSAADPHGTLFELRK